VLIIFSLIIISPFYLLIVNSLKSVNEFFVSPFSLPEVYEWSNFSKAWTEGNLFRCLINTILTTGGALVLIIFCSSTAAFALSRKRFRKLNNFLYIFFLVGVMIPSNVSIVPLALHMKFLNLSNSLIGLILVFTAFTIPFSTFIMYGFIKNIPEELTEAAIIDGCNNFGIYFRIILPLARSGLVTVAIFEGVFIWNNLLFPLVLITSANKKTLPIGLLSFRGEFISEYTLMFAGIIISSLPLVLLYLILQSRFIEGMSSGALKG